MQITRRGVIGGAAVGGGLLVAWWALPRNYPNPLTPARGEHVMGAWLKIAEDGVVSVAVPQLEMGQGITTLIPQIVAQELGADWRQIAVEPAAAAPAYANTALARRWIELWDPLTAGVSQSSDEMLAQRFATSNAFTATADGTWLEAYEAPAREAAAAARAMLAMEAASRWGTSWEECEVEAGIVRFGETQATFGELASGAAEQSPPDPPPLRPEAASAAPVSASNTAQTINFPRIDLPSKVDGSHRFAADVRLPGMVYAAIRHGPSNGSELTGYEAEGAKGIKGVVGAVKTKRWLAVAADTLWAAERAIVQMQPQFTTDFPVSSEDIEARLDTLLTSGDSFKVRETGFGEEAMTRVDMARRYEVEPFHAAPLETASAAAHMKDGQLELWMACQAPEQARAAAAKAVGLSIEDVALYPMSAGGSFDARLEHDHAIEVAQIAQELERPVQLTWSRREEMIRSRPSAPVFTLIGAQLSGGDTAGGAIDALKLRVATPPSVHEFGRRLFGNLTPWAAIAETTGMKDELAIEGAVPVYELPSVTVRHIPVETGYPAGRVRGNAHVAAAFGIESFIDEVAHESGREPLSYRMSMLGTDVRLAACLQRAASLAQWDGGQDQSGQGLACYRIGDAETGGRIACVATARRGEGGLRVTRLTAAVDIGRIINLDIARQQIEGGLLFGLGIALGNSPVMRAGLPESFNYSDLGLPTFADCPEVVVDFLPSTGAHTDPGELGVAVAPPAIANALFSATGLRLRRLPLLSGGL